MTRLLFKVLKKVKKDYSLAFTTGFQLDIGKVALVHYIYADFSFFNFR